MTKQYYGFSTEIREVFKGRPYVKVFFLDDSVAIDAKPVVEALKSVRKVNLTPSTSDEHPGNTLTVYPKPMVDVTTCDRAIMDALSGFFSGVAEVEHPKTDAYFNGIEAQVINDLKQAKVGESSRN